MANTTNFGWETPDDTDLVKDGAAAMRTLGNAIDTSFVDLKGGTTGQVLSKASNTDLDFTWVAQSTSPLTTAGDLYTYSTTDARLAVGSNGDTLVADSAATTGLRWQGNFAAGKNKIINGDFRINQRNFTSNTTSQTYNFDRWKQFNGGTSGTLTVTPQTFTPGTAPVAGYEAINFVRCVTASGANTNTYAILDQLIEDVRTFAGQTITVSFWAKASSGTPKLSVEAVQSFGSGGSANVNTASSAAVTISTSWARYSFTIVVPSVSGKTIGAGSYLDLNIWLSAGSTLDSRSNAIGLQNATFDIWGVQAEAGSVATAFQTATGNLAGELAACQRYYWRVTTTIDKTVGAIAYANTASYVIANIPNPVTMRVAPTSVDFSNLKFGNYAGTLYSMSAVTLDTQTENVSSIYATISGATAGHVGRIITNSTGTSYIGFNAEL